MKQLRLIFSLVLLIQNSDATSSTSTTSTTPPLRLEDRVIDNSQVTKYEITSFTLCHATEKELEQGERSVNSSLLGYLGFSYDPISDESLFPVFDESFSECSKTPDGRFYIPNGYIVEDIGIMYYQKQVTLEEKYKSDSNAKSAGGSGEIKAGGVGGSGGGMVEHTKKKMAKEGNAMFRIIGYNEMYQLSGTFAAPFTRSFMRKIKRAIDFKSQGRHEAALYVIQKVIADYGTDVTISAKIGTFFEHHAFVASTEVSTTTETKLAVQGKVEAKLKNAAGNAGGAVTNSDSDTDGESEVDITFETWASGGPALKKYFGGKEVDLFDDSYPIALSRRTSSIGVMMEGGALGEEPHSVQHAMRRLFDDAANEYFERNTFEGCTNPENANFDYQANADDNSCEGEYCEDEKQIPNECNLVDKLLTTQNETEQDKAKKQFKYCSQNYKFVNKNGYLKLQSCGVFKQAKAFTEGHIYQKCTTNPTTEKFNEELKKLDKDRPNPCAKFTASLLNRGQSCPGNLKEHEIIEYDYVVPDVKIVYEKSMCDKEDEFDCVTIRAEIILREKITISSYWCRPQGSEYSSIGFFGYFDPEQPNNFNGQAACSHGSTPLVFFHDTTLCLKIPTPEDAELTFMYSSKDVRVKCPLNHSRQLITVVNSEKIYGCIYKKQAYYNLDTPEIVQGPYLEERVIDKDHGRSFMIIKENGKYKQKYYLESHGNNIMNQIDEHMKKLPQYNSESIEFERLQKQSVTEYIQLNYIIIVTTIIVLVLCVIACCICLKSVRKP